MALLICFFQSLLSLDTALLFMYFHVLISLIAWIFMKQTLDLAALIGMGFIMFGVVIINLFSKVAGH